ncbi:MAG: hypothetical protein K8F91_13155 [Candidatus Obscuribacterales bacterium]|nr:hypothetical protein [Candidatus Obscuribacterales bacterium]
MSSVRHYRSRSLTAMLAGLALSLPLLTDAHAAENLALRKGISFVQDIDAGFPIEAEKMDDTKVEPGKPTFIFFGARGDLNTSRQAKRVVGIYNRFAKQAVKFIIIDVDNPPNEDATALLKAHYKGYIPCQVVLNSQGRPTWNKVGEVPEKEVADALGAQLQ